MVFKNPHFRETRAASRDSLYVTEEAEKPETGEN
jgi:hypothetical protein